MGISRFITRALIQGPVLPAMAILGGLLGLDRLVDRSSRRVRRGQARRLTPPEILEAERVFGNAIPYEDVRVVESSGLAKSIAALSNRVHLQQQGNLAVTVFNTIHFSTELETDLGDMPWLIHELTHVWQYCHRGPRYLTDALQAQSQLGDGAYDIRQGMAEGWPWERFNPEQQGDIARDYYRALVARRDASALQVYEPYLKVLRSRAVER